jgi:hypothetical protein
VKILSHVANGLRPTSLGAFLPGGTATTIIVAVVAVVLIVAALEMSRRNRGS